MGDLQLGTENPSGDRGGGGGLPARGSQRGRGVTQRGPAGGRAVHVPVPPFLPFPPPISGSQPRCTARTTRTARPPTTSRRISRPRDGTAPCARPSSERCPPHPPPTPCHDILPCRDSLRRPPPHHPLWRRLLPRGPTPCRHASPTSRSFRVAAPPHIVPLPMSRHPPPPPSVHSAPIDSSAFRHRFISCIATAALRPLPAGPSLRTAARRVPHVTCRVRRAGR